MMKYSMIGLAALCVAGAATLHAQAPTKVTSATRIKVQKEPTSSSSAPSTYVPPVAARTDTAVMTDTTVLTDTAVAWYTATPAAH